MTSTNEVESFSNRLAILDNLTAPVNWSTFVSEYWGKSFFHGLGGQGRFDFLLTWREINFILEHHRLQPPRLRLFNDGKAVDVSRYLTDPTADRPRLRSEGLVSCLADGATLIINQVDELASGVRELAEALEEASHLPTSASLYAGWRTQKGLDLHWDPNDMLILQLSGRKHWKVYSQTRSFPLPQDVEDCPKPVEKPIWDGILNSGEMLYIPRGWWHVAFPLNEPSLHLAFTPFRRNGVEFLKWIVDRMKTYPEVRMDLPDLENGNGLREHISRLRERLNQACTLESEEAYLLEESCRIKIRPRIELPLSPMGCDFSITSDTRLQLADAHGLVFELNGTDNGKATFRAGGIRWSCSRSLIPALSMLKGTMSHSLAELSVKLEEGSTTEDLATLITSLSLAGVIRTERIKQT